MADLLGRFRVRAVDACLGKSQNAGTDQIEILCEIVEEGRWKGERVLFFGSFAGDAGPVTIKQMKATGWHIGDTPASIKGKVFEVDVVKETYQGKERRRVRIATQRERCTTVETYPEQQAADMLAKYAAAGDDVGEFPQ